MSDKIQVATQKTSKSGFFWNDKKEQLLADCRAEIPKHEFQAEYDRRSIQKLTEAIESQRGETGFTSFILLNERPGSPRLALNRRLLTREGPEPACKHPTRTGWHTLGRKDELTSCRGTV